MYLSCIIIASCDRPSISSAHTEILLQTNKVLLLQRVRDREKERESERERERESERERENAKPMLKGGKHIY